MSNNAERKEYLQKVSDAIYDAVFGRNYRIRVKGFAAFVLIIMEARRNDRDFMATTIAAQMISYACLRSKRNLNLGISEYQTLLKEGFIDERKNQLAVSPKPAVLDLSAFGENLSITATQFSEILHKKDLPADFQAVLHSFCAEVKQ